MSPASHLEDADFADADTSVSISFVDVGGSGSRARQVPVWDDETSYDFNNMTEEEKRERWDERLVVGGGWLYRQDMGMADLAHEREIVGKYIDAVDEVLFGGFKEGKRGWERERERIERKERMEREMRAKGRRVSAGDAAGPSSGSSARANRRVVSTGLLDGLRGLAVTEEPEEMEAVQEEEEEEEVDDEDLPIWAKRTSFADDDYGMYARFMRNYAAEPLSPGRLHSMLVAFLPAIVLRLLPVSSSDHGVLLNALSSGQLLCHAYNHAVRRSRKPWGYVNKDAIHDIAALEEAQSAQGTEGQNRRGWTFRRTDNLRLWAAYVLSLSVC